VEYPRPILGPARPASAPRMGPNRPPLKSSIQTIYSRYRLNIVETPLSVAYSHDGSARYTGIPWTTTLKRESAS